MANRISIRRVFLAATLIFGLPLLGALGTLAYGQTQDRAKGGGSHPPVLKGRIVAVGIRGASTISPVGTFLPGGPIHDNPDFAAYTEPGEILDPTRILVGSPSNFGAPLVNEERDDEGSFLSIDPNGAQTLDVPRRFAKADGQVSVLGGRVKMFSANSAAFLNGINNPNAVTADFTGVNNPLGMSINNAFGRLWPANAWGLRGIGSSTILDPTGIPLAGAPNQEAGGVFASNLTPRLPSQLLPGALDTGAVGTAFLGHSPDGSGRAVFSVVLADGSLVQVHTEQAVDGLAPEGTISPLIQGRHEEDEHGVLPRLGVILNYEPHRILYVSEPLEDRIAALLLSDDGAIFHVAAMNYFESSWLNYPVDLAPAEIETEHPNWSSNTTLEVGADFYIANRGDNTIVRMRQDGTVAAVRRVGLKDGKPLKNNVRLNGIAVSPDASTIWVTVTGPGHSDGAVLELPAFDE